MSKPIPNQRKIIVRAFILLLAVSFWVLGDVKKNYWIKDSPDGRFSTSIVAHRGWRHVFLGGHYFLYVRDNKTGESVLAARHPENCVLSRIDLKDIKWEKNNRRFICLWRVEYNGVHKQYFSLENEPLHVKAGPPCCGIS